MYASYKLIFQNYEITEHISYRNLKKVDHTARKSQWWFRLRLGRERLLSIALINAVNVHVHWDTKFQLFMQKKKNDLFNKFWKKKKTRIFEIRFILKWKGSTLKTR